MTEPETLTAAERALLEHAASVTSCRIDGRVVARWMHCHDAALARAEAATRDSWNQGTRADEAESALAEATALLERWIRSPGFCDVRQDTDAFLSATPAPASLPVGTPEQRFEEWVDTHPDNPNRRTPAPAATAEPLGGPVEPGQTCVPVYDPSCSRCRETGKRCGICAHYVKQQETRESDALVERIEAELMRNGHTFRERAVRALALIRASTAGGA